MTDFKIRRGYSTTLFSSPGIVNPKLIIELGCWYLCIDTAELFVGVLGSDNKPTLKRINETKEFALFKRIENETELPTDFTSKEFNPNITYYIVSTDEKNIISTFIFDSDSKSYLRANNTISWEDVENKPFHEKFITDWLLLADNVTEDSTPVEAISSIIGNPIQLKIVAEDDTEQLITEGGPDVTVVREEDRLTITAASSGPVADYIRIIIDEGTLKVKDLTLVNDHTSAFIYLPTTKAISVLNEESLPESVAKKTDIPEISYPITSVNSQTGDVKLKWDDLGVAQSYQYLGESAEDPVDIKCSLGIGTKVGFRKHQRDWNGGDIVVGEETWVVDSTYEYSSDMVRYARYSVDLEELSFCAIYEEMHYVEAFIPEEVSIINEKYLPPLPPIPEQVQTDWASDDETSASYIQNRTHYTVPRKLLEVFSCDLVDYSGQSYKVIDSTIGPFFSGKYLVTINSVQYECNSYRDPYNTYSWGTLNIPNVFSLSTYCEGDHYTCYITCSESGNVSIKVEKIVSEETVVTLPEKYIPETIARTKDIPEVPVTSVNGQTGDVVIDVPVTSVQGRSGDIQLGWSDFGEVVVEEVTFLSAGEDAEYGVSFDSAEFYGVEGTSIAPGDTYVVNFGGDITYSFPLNSYVVTVGDDYGMHISGNRCILHIIYDVSSNKYTFTAETEIMPEFGFPEPLPPGKVSIIKPGSNTIIPIDEKFIPETIARVSDIENSVISDTDTEELLGKLDGYVEEETTSE